jgi:hypothetical protein
LGTKRKIHPDRISKIPLFYPDMELEEKIIDYKSLKNLKVKLNTGEFYTLLSDDNLQFFSDSESNDFDYNAPSIIYSDYLRKGFYISKKNPILIKRLYPYINKAAKDIFGPKISSRQIKKFDMSIFIKSLTKKDSWLNPVERDPEGRLILELYLEKNSISRYLNKKNYYHSIYKPFLMTLKDSNRDMANSYINNTLYTD